MADSGRILVILGPTAGGKSDLAVELAQRLDGQIIGADSMQIYRHLNAGTAKPSARQRAAAVHHLIDLVDPTERFTVADWLERAEAAIEQIQSTGQLPIVVGGTNLYLKALLEGMFEGPPADPAFRKSLTNLSPQQMHEQLTRTDPEAAERIHPNDRKRIERALEVHHVTGRPISQMQQQWAGGVFADGQSPGADQPRYRHNPVMIGLRWPPERINRRINARVKAMFNTPPGVEDLLAETRRLHSAGMLGPQAAEALGTKQVLAHLAGQMDLPETIERIKIDTRRFAKAQRTWLKRYRRVHWLEPAGLPTDPLIDQAVNIARQHLR